MPRVEIVLLGGFAVRVDGRPVTEREWSRRSASSLVKLLALAPGRRLHREQVIDALWPDLTLDEAGPRLHKAAHFARKALGVPDAVVARADTVALCPAEDVLVDAAVFQQAATEALAADPDPDTQAEVLRGYGGELLPHDLYEPWTEDARRHLASLHAQLLRAAGRWEELLALDPSDEEAHVALIRAHAERGDRTGALRQFERLEHAVRRELGVAPGREAQALRAQLLQEPGPERAGAGEQPPRDDLGSGRLLARETQLRMVAEAMDLAGAGRGRTVFVTAGGGLGKTALLDWVRERAGALGWRHGSGTASDIEGTWPYAPVLEALADLCRAHPTLMDGLDDTYRDEVERAMRGETGWWSGNGGHQRLFVAAAELLELAAAGPGAVLLLDDMHDADEASLRLVHYLARAAGNQRALLVLSQRPDRAGDALHRVRRSLLGRRAAVEVDLSPLSLDEVAELIASQLGDAPEPSTVAQVHAATGGNPLQVVELARAVAGGLPVREGGRLSAAGLLRDLPTDTVEAMQRAAVLGAAFDTDEFVEVSGLDEATAYSQLDRALATGVLQRTEHGFRLRHAGLRDALLGDLPQHRERWLHRNAASALARLAASPARIGHHLVRGGDLRAAVPYALASADTAAAMGAYRDALQLVEDVRPAAEGAERARLLLLRADLLLAVGDSGAVPAYRDAVDAAAPADRPHAQARLARAAALAGDLDTARESLAGLDSLEDADVPILLARGTVAYFSGDLETAAAASEQARQRMSAGADWQLLDLVALQGMVAHDRGQWFARLRHELSRTKQAPAIATAVFDSHLCVAEYLLYGPTPYADVLALADELRRTAERAGALRAVAFASTLAGEAALLSGDLEAAERQLLDAVDLHREISASAGEAHSLQRLAELRLVQGDRAEATALLRRALPLARWSPIALHLLQRIHGTLVRAADTQEEARAAVDRAEATLGSDDFCFFCEVMFAVPAAIACADVGDLTDARRHLEDARRSASLWHGTAWEAATLEAQAHVMAADGEEAAARRLLLQAAELFRDAGQPWDAQRCQDKAVAESGPAVPQARQPGTQMSSPA